VKPFNPDIVVARIAEKTDCFRHISVAPGIGYIPRLPELATPGAYVLYPEESRLERPTGMGTFGVSVRVGIAVVVAFAADMRGQKSPPGHDVFELVGKVRAAMTGWMAPDKERKTAAPYFESGGIGLDNDSILVWVDYWKFPSAIRSQ